MAFWLRLGFILSYFGGREVLLLTFFTSLDESMKPNLSQKAMKLGSNDN